MAPSRALVLVAGLAVCLAALPGTARASTSTATNPTVTFSTPGTRTVSLQVCNAGGCSTMSKQVTVLDPTPVITLATTDGLVAGAVSVEAGQLVHLVGAGTGKPALDFSWTVLFGVTPFTTVPAAVPGSAEAWWDTAGIAPGVYTAALHLANPVGSVDSLPFTITVLPAPALVFYALTPCRLLDTRGGTALASGSTQAFNLLTAGCGVPPEARALALNVTAVGATASGSLNVFPGNYPLPTTNVVSFPKNLTRAVNSVVALDSGGGGTVAARADLPGGGKVDLVLDVSGYFAPEPPAAPAGARRRR